MYKLQVSTNFAAAHHLREYKGKCENVHGHNWYVQATVAADQTKSDGMVMDFGDFKKALNAVIDELDHTDINELPHFKEVNPTSENIAFYIYNKLSEKIHAFDPSVKVASVAVEENKGSIAIYEP